MVFKVHKFDQDADETLGWLEEKEAHQVALEGEDISRADLPALKQLMNKYDEFMRGVMAVEKQVYDLYLNLKKKTKFELKLLHLRICCFFLG